MLVFDSGRRATGNAVEPLDASVDGSEGVTHRLHPDQAVAEDEGVDSVLGLGLRGRRLPFDEQDVVLEQGRGDLPLGVGEIAEQPLKRLSDTILAAQNA